MADKRALGAYPDIRQIPDTDTVQADHLLFDSGGHLVSAGALTYTGKLTMGTVPTKVRKLTSAPAVGDLSVGEGVIVDTGSVRRLYFRVS
jgi:hypothetical protein